MLWMETIRLRTGGFDKDHWIDCVRGFEAEIKKEPGIMEWHIYGHAAITGDFSILFQWDTAGVDPLGSPLALSLANSLSVYGMVDHSVWIKHGILEKE